MIHFVRNFARHAATILLLASPFVGGCSAGLSDSEVSKVEAWLPKATSRASGAALDSLQTSDGTNEAATSRPVVAMTTLIGSPRIVRGRTWYASYVVHPASIEQDLLTRTMDGRFFSTTYVWKDDPILVTCVESPDPCAKFDVAHALSPEEAKALLSRSEQFSPALYQKFFAPAQDKARA